ncbi:DUF1822 family protein [Calothrix sp. PCC 7507]|uniref:DUF1822 family protein n=1 Tax=Calothrix sp. PCC 7507 TaxID=99598 RepID=UPI00029F2E1C|nr:DUF1822 family protein [Calothrix sp. PCC 7507]AFY34971.1 protein of unknown function DUF1822 [Calothrix sp. PCC 7507]
MTNTTYQLEDFAVPLPITQAARRTAQQFAKEQGNPEKAEQIRLNTLAVWVVNDYLQMMDVTTDLHASDSWNPVMRICANVADLEIPAVGRLECRPVRLHDLVCAIPPETWEERVGYVAVQIDESLQEAKLLGFVPSVAIAELPLSQLLSPEAFIDHLAQLKRSPIPTLVNLSQWFIGIFESGWQTIDALWNSPELRPAYGFRSPEQLQETLTKRAKLIDLGIQIANKPVMLIVEISPEANHKTSVRLQLHPTSSQVYLPQGVQLTVLDESGAVFLEAQARSADNYIQLQFRGDSKEHFRVKVALNDTSITEQFVI